MEPEDPTTDVIDPTIPVDTNTGETPISRDEALRREQAGPTKPGEWRDRDANRRAQGDDDLKA